MGVRFLAAVLGLLVLGGCSEKEFTCSNSGQCIDRYGASGLCLQTHCAFPSNMCSSGYAWDDAAGDLASQCVDSVLVPVDAGPATADARPPDAG